MPADFDKDLSYYFTDVEHLRDAFRQMVAAPTLGKRLFVIWGIGGVGKSSLLRMFRLHCKGADVPVALASGDEAKSVLEVLARWMDDLKAAGVALPSFGKTLEYYRTILARAESEAGEIAGKMAKGAAKAATETVLSTVPGFGPLLAKLGGVGVDALTDMLLSRGFKKPDIDLLLNPAGKLTDDFLADVAQAADSQRLVLMLDTFEQMPGLEDWTRSLAQRLHENVLLVIAGRGLPDWNRAWPEWLAKAQTAELKPMTDDVMAELVRRYYATMRGGEPDPQQVEAIIKFARGLPLVVTSVVQLWVKYPERMGDLRAISREVMADLVDRLVEGVPQEMLPTLEAAAAVRWFDHPILREITGLADVREVYNELRRFPFVRPRAEGLALHDAVREIIDANLRGQDADRHCELHERAAAYFEKRLGKATGEEAERLGLERLYHRVLADEEAGIKLFQEMAEELTRYRLVNRLRALLNDANMYPLERESSKLWREYYNAREMQLRRRRLEAENIYRAIGGNPNAQPKLQAYALCDLGELLGSYNQNEPAVATIEKGLALVSLDSKLVSGFVHLSFALHQLGRFAQGQAVLERAKDYYEQTADKYGLASVLNSLKDHFLGQGEPAKARICMQSAMDTVSAIYPVPIYLRFRILESWTAPWTWYGDRHQVELWLMEADSIKSNFDPEYTDKSYVAGQGYVLGLQDKYEESERSFSQAFAAVSKFTDRSAETSLAIQLGNRGAVLRRAGLLYDAEEALSKSLAIKQKVQDTSGMPEVLVWLGELFEVKALHEDSGANQRKAESHYRNVRNYRQYRPYFDAAALMGLIRVKHAQAAYDDIPPLLAEAEQLAQQYEYNDHLASLRLTQGHLALTPVPSPGGKGEGDGGWGEGFDAALRYYRLALIYALRYNRFLLDEVLSGRPQGTPLRPIIPSCLARGEEGRRMLIALRDWWQTGVNDIGAPRPDTISPIPEGIPLQEAERIAREREPGDNSPQKSVIEQLGAALLGNRLPS